MLNYADLAREKGTPIYVYDLDGFRQRLNFFKSHVPQNGRVFYALKANNNPHILKMICEAGFGVDVVSQGEMECALKAGFLANQIIFSGVGKTVKEIRRAIELQISQINVESEPELRRIVECAREMKKTINVAFRVNPDVDANTHPYIRTGFRDNKFGIDFTEISNLLALVKENTSAVKLVGLTLHIGSQIREIGPFKAAIQKALALYKSLKANGYPVSVLDVGGGLGIDYQNSNISADERLIENYFAVIQELLVGEVENVYFEPGRILVARFGALVTEIQYVKRTPFKNFIIVDTGMHHIIRPSLYQAFHRIEPVEPVKTDRKELFDVVGPICESTDTIGVGRYLPATLTGGDLLVIHDVGAYGSVMSSDYNMRDPAVEISILKDQVL